jgi:hypothetical protein
MLFPYNKIQSFTLIQGYIKKYTLLAHDNEFTTLYIYIYIHTHTHTHTYIYIYRHNHTHTHTRTHTHINDSAIYVRFGPLDEKDISYKILCRLTKFKTNQRAERLFLVQLVSKFVSSILNYNRTSNTKYNCQQLSFVFYTEVLEFASQRSERLLL